MAPRDFQVEETTIADVHRAFREGSLTCRALVEAYLARIAAYDKNGPELNAIITINEHALDEADRLDQEFARTGKLTGPLHGVPVVVKDQAETAGITTTFGSIACEGYVPERDATAVAQLKDDGAIILAKTTMPDFATSWFSYSSKSGTTRNPYQLDHDPGGSSSGTAAAVAANLALVGVGEDTGGSIRLPSSFCNLVGLKVTPGLISRTGMSPLVVFQDSAGPIGRTVRDVALLLDSLAGFDPDDVYTATYAIAGVRDSYAARLDASRMSGVKIGVVRAAFGSDDDPDSAPVNNAIAMALDSMREAGAELIDVEIPNLMDWIMNTSLYITHSKHDMNAFFASRGELESLRIEDLHASGKTHPKLDLIDEIVTGPDDPHDDPEYYEKYFAREEFQRLVVGLMAANGLAALCFPTVQVVPPSRAVCDSDRWTVLTFPTNTLIGAQTWMPALTLPAGFTDGGLPVGIEFLGFPYGEDALLQLGYAFEQVTRKRAAPSSVPPL